ncbi:MAG: DNA-3-methyladenine glycosylase 2 family protein [Nitriliruptoraceae bacterium]|nr:DNA-3-methyladenine glycosylase 2 family protein [Nitriliruptoraceae bacterium]
MPMNSLDAVAPDLTRDWDTVATRTIAVPEPLHLMRSLRLLVHAAQDPTIRLRDDRLVRCSWTLDGPATVEVVRRADGRADVRAFGPGRERLLTLAPALLGTDDDAKGFVPGHHPAVARAAHRRPGLRMIATGHVTDILVPTILAQRVTSKEAAVAWTRLVRRYGRPAPGPHGLQLPPHPAELAVLPDWDWYRLGVERSRAARIRRAMAALPRLQEAVAMDHEPGMAQLTGVPGVGEWTAAHVRRVASGDPDAVEVGDYSVKDHIAWNLAGEPRASDERMLELLSPWAGQRGRVVRLLLSAGQRPPTFGARQRIIGVETL